MYLLPTTRVSATNEPMYTIYSVSNHCNIYNKGTVSTYIYVHAHVSLRVVCSCRARAGEPCTAIVVRTIN